MKNKILTLVLAMLFASCEKDDKKDSIETTKTVFYTNAQIVTNCGDFNVDVYIDEEYKGTLQTAYSAGETSILCNAKAEDGSLLIVNLKQGKHTYKAIPDCVEKEVYYGEFNIENTGCQSVFIDIFNSEIIKTDTIADIFGLYTIKVPKGYTYSASYGDCSYSFKTYSDNGNIIIEWDSEIYATDTLYELKNVYVKNYKLPQSDSVIRSQTFPNMEIIEKKGLLYYTTDKISSGYFFIKKEDHYILLFSIVIDINNISELKNILLTVEKQ